MGFKAEAAREGRPGYDPRDMLKLYMYGYSNHIRSSRRLQKEAARNVEVMWLLKKIVPDFRCIADFRKDNAKAIKEVFRAFVKLCNGAGLLSHESVVIDGSKFRAVNADNKSYLPNGTNVILRRSRTTKWDKGRVDQTLPSIIRLPEMPKQMHIEKETNRVLQGRRNPKGSNFLR